MLTKLNPIQAVGFDLFNTLIMPKPGAFTNAFTQMTKSLNAYSLIDDLPVFQKTYLDAMQSHVEKARQSGKETHNRFWISDTLSRLDKLIAPDDSRIMEAVTAYFSAFFEFCTVIPETINMLDQLKNKYKIGLLSNFTDGPTGRQLLDHLKLINFFDVILISGEMGYRKPHKRVFQMLLDKLDVRPEEMIYIGDDPDADISGALSLGIKPVLTTYVRDTGVDSGFNMLSKPHQIDSEEYIRISSWDELSRLL